MTTRLLLVIALLPSCDSSGTSGERGRPEVIAEAAATAAREKRVDDGPWPELANGVATPADAAPLLPPRANPLKVTSAKLSADYGENEIAADAKYRGKFLCVEGRVMKVEKNLVDESPIVGLRGRNDFESVVFAFQGDEARDPNLATLTRRMDARICGYGWGATLGSPIVKRSKLVAVRQR